jgi:hypothetical protein
MNEYLEKLSYHQTVDWNETLMIKMKEKMNLLIIDFKNIYISYSGLERFYKMFSQKIGYLF